MKFHSLIQYALALTASLLVAGCGGGGATGNPNQGGPISVSPGSGTFFAGIPSTITLQGGRRPYAVTSSEPSVLAVPPIVDANSFEVIPNNPGVIDSGLQPGELAVRTVVISVRDLTGILVTASIKVARNFLTGYGFVFTSTTCANGSLCPGGQAVLQLKAITNGSLYGLKPFRLEIVRGPIAFVDPLSSDNLVTKINVSSDHEGKITVVVRGLATSGAAIGVIRVVDIGSGASQEQAFTIDGTPASTLSALPASFTFTGPNATTCGTGTGDFTVFGASPGSILTATVPGNNPGLSVSPATVTTTSSTARFTVSAASTNQCLDNAPILVTDQFGASVTILVTTKKGVAAPAPPAMVVAPNSIALNCGGSGAVSVASGSGNYAVNSDSQGVSAFTSGNSISITRRIGDPVGGYPTPMHVSVTDGTTIQVIVVTAPGFCP